MSIKDFTLNQPKNPSRIFNEILAFPLKNESFQKVELDSIWYRMVLYFTVGVPFHFFSPHEK
jgi:hypothetical protein